MHLDCFQPFLLLSWTSFFFLNWDPSVWISLQEFNVKVKHEVFSNMQQYTKNWQQLEVELDL